MIYEGQAKRRMAKILEPRPCICPKCRPVIDALQVERNAVMNMRIDNIKMTQNLRTPKSKEAQNARR